MAKTYEQALSDAEFMNCFGYGDDKVDYVAVDHGDGTGHVDIYVNDEFEKELT